MRLSALKKIKVNKKFIILVAIMVAASFFVVSPVYAIPDWIGQVVGGLIFIFIWALGQIVLLVMRVLLAILQYQDFIGAPAVIQGWLIVRDVANMFFVVILLVISFATILHIEEYNYKKWLPKLILMAILINFSRTICGVLIDVTQLVMLTFVNSFRSIAGGSFVEMLGIRDVLTFAKSEESIGESIGGGAIIGAYVLGFVYMLISLVVLTTMTLILVMRLVMIWIYVVLSPLAYLLSAFPGGAKYASKWWTDFTSNLIVGPVLAFFIWLSFASLQTTSDPSQFNFAATENESTFVSSEAQGIDNGPPMATEASRPGVLIKFIIGIGMLIGGMKIAQEVGGAAGAIAGKGMGVINKMASGVSKRAGKYGINKAKFAGRSALGVGAGAMKLGGMGLGVISKGKLGAGMQSMGDSGLNLRRDLIADKEKNKVEGRKKFLRTIGASAETADKFSQDFGDKKDPKSQKEVRNKRAAVNTATLVTMGIAGGSAFGPLGSLAGAGAGAIIAGILRQVSKVRDNQVQLSQTDLDGKQATLAIARTDYNHVLTAAGGDVTNPAVVAEKKNLDKAQGEVDVAKNDLQVKQGKGGTFMAEIYKAVDGVTSFSTGLTTKAAESLAKDKEYGRKQVEAMSKNPNYIVGATDSALYRSTGQTGELSEVVKELVNPNNKDAPIAITNIESELSRHTPGVNPVFDKKLGLFLQNIAASDVKGEVSMGPLANIIAILDSKVAAIGDPKVLDTLDNYKKSVIPYRQTGTIGQEGTGKLYVDSMAKGKKGHELAGVDFNKLQEKGLNIETSAEGAYIKGEDMAKFGPVLSQIIGDTRKDLETAHSNKEITDDQYTEQSSTLDKADARLKNGSFDQTGIKLLNSKSANFGRNAVLATEYHETVHQGGIPDEGVAEGISMALMNGKLYGRNAATGGTHVAEITALAKAMKDKGASGGEILKAMTVEISQRSKNEATNRASQVMPTGEIYVDSIATGKQNHNMAGVDFNMLGAKGFPMETTANSAYIKAEDMPKFRPAMSQVIGDARKKLKTAHDNKEITDDEYTEKYRTLGRADKQLKDGRFNKSGVMLVNSAGANFNRSAKLTNSYKEAVHQGGVKDKGLAEGLAVALMNGKLYGRNATTGGTHVAEITALAKAMKSGGSNNDDILKAMSAEISQRSQAETTNRASQVLSMEQGKAPTETQAVSEMTAAKQETTTVVVDTSGIEAAISGIKNAFGDIKIPAPVNLSSGLDAVRRVVQLGTATQVKHIAKVADAILDINRVIADGGNTPLIADAAFEAMTTTIKSPTD